MTEVHDLTQSGDLPATPEESGLSGRRGWAAPAIAGVLAIAMATAGALTLGGGDDTSSVTTADRGPGGEIAPPPGFRFAGVGHAAVAVPESWGTNKTHCGTPKKDTVIVHDGATATCLTPRPVDVESVEVGHGDPRFDFSADREVEIDGVAAQRQDTTCGKEVGDVTVCSGTVYIPSERAEFRAESSTGAAEVDRILSRIRMVPEMVAVPDHSGLQAELQERSQRAYTDELQELGLDPVVRTKLMRGTDAGHVLEVDPTAGTMLRPGDAVTMTVTGEPSGPADELTVGMGTSDADDEYGRSLSDEEIRDGTTIRLDVGGSIWAYAAGKREETLMAEMDGDALTPSTWKEGPNYGRSWVADRPGRSTVTLSITADGERIELGTVTVVVR